MLSGEGQGSYVGLGPKGYQRSDERIREDVVAALTRSMRVDATHIDVSSSGGEVTLTGTVADRQQKRSAERCAELCSGVTDVHNLLRLRAAADTAMVEGDPQTDDILPESSGDEPIRAGKSKSTTAATRARPSSTAKGKGRHRHSDGG